MKRRLETPATASAASSTDSETPRSSLIIPTRAEGASQSERRANILAPLRDSFPTPRGGTSNGAEVGVTGNINIMQQLQDFFQRQEAFNARVEESLQRRVEETQAAQQRRPRRLPKAVTVSSLSFVIVVVAVRSLIRFVEFHAR